MEFLKKIQAHWVLLIFFFGFLAKIFGIYDNFVNIWHAPKTIYDIEKQSNDVRKQLCDSVALQKSIIISNSSVFNAFLVAQKEKDTQSIEIIKEMAKMHLHSQKEMLEQLLNKCND